MVYKAKNFQNDARQLNIIYKESRENEEAHSLLSECIKIISRTEVSCMPDDTSSLKKKRTGAK